MLAIVAVALVNRYIVGGIVAWWLMEMTLVSSSHLMPECKVICVVGVA